MNHLWGKAIERERERVKNYPVRINIFIESKFPLRIQMNFYDSKQLIEPFPLIGIVDLTCKYFILKECQVHTHLRLIIHLIALTNQIETNIC